MIRQKSIIQITIISYYNFTLLLRWSMNYLKQRNFLLFVKENSSFRQSQVLSFLCLLKSFPTKFKPLSDKLEKEACVLLTWIFLLNQMNCEIITEGKLGKKVLNFLL